jgi:nitroreductase
MMDLIEAINKRKSIRQFSDEVVTKDEIMKLVKAGSKAPSAGGIRPLEFHVIVFNTDMKEGECNFTAEQALFLATFKQDIKAPAYIIICGDFEKMRRKYRRRGIRYVYMEAGHAAQNIYLVATAMGLGTVAIGAFNDAALKEITGLDPLYIMPIGRIK